MFSYFPDCPFFSGEELFLGASPYPRYVIPSKKRRGSQVVRRGSAKAVCVGSIPTLASLPIYL